MTTTLAREIAMLVTARQNCIKSNNTEWLATHTLRLRDLVRNRMPSGSGVDSGTKIDLDASTGERLVFTAEFHHMDENGSYDGWTSHTITVRASLAFGLDIRIGGRDRNGIKDHLHETFSDCLRQEFDAASLK